MKWGVEQDAVGNMAGKPQIRVGKVWATLRLKRRRINPRMYKKELSERSTTRVTRSSV